MRKGVIICVDDQPEVVGSLMTQLESAVGHLCEIEVAESAFEALDVLKELKEQGEQIEIVITDEIMPGMQGSKLLEIVHQLDPNIMTVMLTGQAGFDDVVYAVNHAALNKCLKKPWEYQELKDTVLDLLEKAELNRKYERLTQEVVAEKNKAEAIVQSITDGIIVVNDEDKISLVNQACLDLLGRSEKDLIGKRLLHVLDSRELALLFVEASQRTDEVISEEFVLKRTEKTPSWPIPAGKNPDWPLQDEVTVVAIAKTLRDKYQHQIGVVTVLRDVTHEKEISRMKANFLATISHELRTPLTSILSTYELLLQDSLGELTQEQREFINLSKQQGEYLSELIDNLIVLNKLEANQIDIAAAPLDLARIAREASSTAKISASAKGLTFHLDIESPVPQIVADETQITHLIKNLLSNAVKFTETGEIRLKIASEALANQKGIHIAVTDTGIGIAAPYFEKIFEKFFQIDNSTTREFGGPGVGLAICRAIVQAHHGRIWVESQVAKGSTFHVLLPRNPSDTG